MGRGAVVVLTGVLVDGDLPGGPLHRSLSQQVILVPARPLSSMLLICLHSRVHARVVMSFVTVEMEITVCNDSAECETHE